MAVEFPLAVSSIDVEWIWVEKSVKIWLRAPPGCSGFHAFSALLAAVRGFQQSEKTSKIVKIMHHARNVTGMWSKKHGKKSLLFTTQLQRYWGSNLHEIENLNL